MPTRNVVLTDRQAEMVARLVESGCFQNASEVMRHGLRLVEREQTEAEARLEALRRAVDSAAAGLAAGRFREFDTAEALRRHLLELTDAALAGPLPDAADRA